MIFVSYSWSGNKGRGFGNTVIGMEGIFSPDDLVKATEDVQALYREYEKGTGKSADIVILNWRKLDERGSNA